VKPEFRIKQNNKGKFEVYFVEVVGTSYFFENKVVLKPFITYSGSDRIFEFSSLEIAIKELKQEVIKQTEIL
jgi:hypothetical protein